METLNINFGDTVKALIFGIIEVSGLVTGTGSHKGYQVVDLIQADGSKRFVYIYQITELNGKLINIKN